MTRRFIILFLVLLFSGVIGFSVLAEEAVNTPMSLEVLTTNASLPVNISTVIEEVTAQDLGVSPPKLLPTSSLYFLKDWWRGIKLGLTFNAIKKEELRLKQMNERLLEVEALFDQPVDAKSQEKIEKVLAKYQEGANAFQAQAEELKTKMENNEQLQTLLSKYTDWELKRQYLMKKMENQETAQAEVKDRLRQSMEASLNSLVTAAVLWQKSSEWKNDLTSALDQAGELRKMYNLETLQNLEVKMPVEAKEAIQTAEVKALEQINQSLEAVDNASQVNLLQKFLDLKPSTTVVQEVLKIEAVSNQIKEQLQNVPTGSVETQTRTAPEAIQDTLDLFEMPSSQSSTQTVAPSQVKKPTSTIPKVEPSLLQ